MIKYRLQENEDGTVEQVKVYTPEGLESMIRMDLRTLQREAHAIAKDHGWWDEPRSFGDCIALVHSELSEALEEYRKHGLTPWKSRTYSDGFKDGVPDYIEGKPEGVAAELADVVIRVADMAEFYRVRSPWQSEPYKPASHRDMSFGEWITTCHSALDTVWGDACVYDVPSRATDTSLWHFLNTVQAMAAHYGIDLDAAIEAKLEYNKTRPYRHGGKVL